MAKLSGLIESGKIGKADQKAVSAMPDAHLIPTAKPAEKDLVTKSQLAESDAAAETMVFGAHEMDLSESRSVSMAAVRPSPYQVNEITDSDYIEELMESIMQSGVISPLVVRELDDGIFELIAGHHRYEACRRLGHSEVRVVVRAMSNSDAARALVADNFVHKDRTDYERYKHAKMLKENRFCVTGREVATVLGVSPAKVSQLMTFESFPEGAKALMEATPGLMGCESAYSLKNFIVDEPDLFTEALRLIGEGKLVASKIPHWIESRYKPATTRLQARQEIKISRPGLNPIKLTYTDREAKIQADGLDVERLRKLIEDNLESLLSR